jgi:spore photoproduct lyase
MQTTDPIILNDRKALITDVQKGEFFKPCPGTTKGYLCCGYQILTPLTGCGMYCSYCVLQAYFDHQCQVVYENFGDLEKEVEQKLSQRQGIVRIGTGEFADSLFQENNLGLCKKVADLLDPYANVIVEFKTKSASRATIEGLSRIKNPRKVVIGFSMNTPTMIEAHERDTASLTARLSMMATCEEMGFFVAIHFDPIFHYDKWESDYRDVVRRIFAHIKDPETIAWWSMGGFRTNPALKRLLKKENRHLPLFAQSDLVLGEDGKYRYFRPIRTAFYRALQEEVARYDPQTALYLCMESPEVWSDAGMSHRIPAGLVRYLDKRAEKLLGKAGFYFSQGKNGL